MKRLISVMMCAVAIGAAAQSTINYPYNPTKTPVVKLKTIAFDLLGFLTVYGNTCFAIPGEPTITGCNYTDDRIKAVVCDGGSRSVCDE